MRSEELSLDIGSAMRGNSIVSLNTGREEFIDGMWTWQRMAQDFEEDWDSMASEVVVGLSGDERGRLWIV